MKEVDKTGFFSSPFYYVLQCIGRIYFYFFFQRWCMLYHFFIYFLLFPTHTNYNNPHWSGGCGFFIYYWDMYITFCSQWEHSFQTVTITRWSNQLQAYRIITLWLVTVMNNQPIKAWVAAQWPIKLTLSFLKSEQVRTFQFLAPILYKNNPTLAHNRLK